jgi:CRISPR-associated endonuclease Csn1
MSKVLGLDLGTNSIGWAIVDNNEIVAANVSTFQEGVNIKPAGGQEEPLNVAKRNARQQRRQVFYKDYRLAKMTEELARAGMFPCLKGLDEMEQAKQFVAELQQRLQLTDQQIKNYKLNKWKDGCQLNARIAKLVLLKIPACKVTSIDFTQKPETLDGFIEQLFAFIALDPYRLRSQAVTGSITKMELGRICYQIGKKRGFKSSRKNKNKEEDVAEADYKEEIIKIDTKKQKHLERRKKLENIYGDQLELVDEDDEKIVVRYPKKKGEAEVARDKTRKEIAADKFITLGNYLFHKDPHKERIRKETKADRALYVAEFNYIWSAHAQKLGLDAQTITQKKKGVFANISMGEFLGHERTGILFYQRPLKSQKHLVAACTFANKTIRYTDAAGKETSKKTGATRCLISHPLYETFRSLQQINNLRINRNGFWEELTGDDRETLLQLFTSECNEAAKVTISKVEKALFIKKSQLSGAAEADVEKELASFSGNYTARKLSALFGENWYHFDRFPKHTQSRIVTQCIKSTGGEQIIHNPAFSKLEKEERRKQVFEKGQLIWNQLAAHDRQRICLERLHEEIWHCFIAYEDNKMLFNKMVADFGLAPEKEAELRKINLKQGYASLSLKAIRKLLPFMQQGVQYSQAIFLANIDGAFGLANWKAFSDEQRSGIYKEVQSVILSAKEEKLRCDVVNAVSVLLKAEAEENKNINIEERMRYYVRRQIPGYVKGLSISDYDEEKLITDFINAVKKQSPAILKPVFLKATPVLDGIKQCLHTTFSLSESRLGLLWHPAKVEEIPPSPHELPEPRFQTLRNPIVKQALYALRTVLKAIVKQHPDIEMVRIELARELNDKNKRIAMRRWNKKLEDERNKNRQKLSEFDGVNPENEANLLKYKLWTELQEINGCHICPYTGKTICFSDLFLTNKFQVEHIIPRSRSWSDAEVNLTLCLNSFNTDIKKEALPYEIMHVTEYGFNKNWIGPRTTKTGKQYYDYQPLIAWKLRADGLRKEIDLMGERLKTMNAGDARDRLMQDKYLKTYERNYYSGKYRRFTAAGAKDIEDDDMVKSQLTDTGYITRLAALYLKSYFGDDRVETVKGATTTMLRDEWEMGDKDRSRHYHHAEDAILIALTNLGRYRQLAMHRKKEKEKGKFPLPWPGFKEDFRNITANVMVKSASRSRKIVSYNKTVVYKGVKQKMRIEAARGEIHKANPYGRVMVKGEALYSSRTAFEKLSEQDWKTNLPQTLRWQPLEPKTEEKTVTKVFVEDVEKPVMLSKLLLLQVPLIKNELVRELIEAKIAAYTGEALKQEQPLPLYITRDIKEPVESKGSGQIKKCQVLVTVKGAEQLDNRKLTLTESGKVLRFNEINLVSDKAIQSAVIARLNEMVSDAEALQKELGAELAASVTEAVLKEEYEMDMPLPDLFFKRKLQRLLYSYGIPIKKVTLHVQQQGRITKIRKAVSLLTYADIEHIAGPAKTIILERLRETRTEGGDSDAVLPASVTGGLFMPVKNIRTHNKANLYPVRPGAYFSFGNTSHVTVYKDVKPWKIKKEPEIFVDPVPFYFALNPNKIKERLSAEMSERIEDAAVEMILRKGDYVILNMQRPVVEEIIDKQEYYKLKDSVFKVTMIFSGGFDLQFRVHYSAKGDQGNVNIKSSDAWQRVNPIKVQVLPTGQIKLI